MFHAILKRKCITQMSAYRLYSRFTQYSLLKSYIFIAVPYERRALSVVDILRRNPKTPIIPPTYGIIEAQKNSEHKCCNQESCLGEI
jgi:hypothetical protein